MEQIKNTAYYEDELTVYIDEGLDATVEQLITDMITFSKGLPPGKPREKIIKPYLKSQAYLERIEQIKSLMVNKLYVLLLEFVSYINSQEFVKFTESNNSNA